MERHDRNETASNSERKIISKMQSTTTDTVFIEQQPLAQRQRGWQRHLQ